MSFNIKNNVFWVGKIDWELIRYQGGDEGDDVHKIINYFELNERMPKGVLYRSLAA